MDKRKITGKLLVKLHKHNEWGCSHSIRVSNYAVEMGRYLGLNEQEAGMVAGFLCLFAVSGIRSGYAYFSGTSEMKINHLSIAKGEQDQEGAIIIVEPEWDARKEADENYAMDMQPGESAIKDPRVESCIDYPCWVFVEVMIPEEMGTLEKADNPYEYVTLIGEGTDYTYAFEIVVPQINEEDWKLYQRSNGKNLISYVYGYKTPLEAYGTTSPVFDTITIPEFKQFEGGENYIMIRAKAVQTEGCATLDDITIFINKEEQRNDERKI